MGQEEKDTYTMIGWMSFRIGYPQRLIMLNREVYIHDFTPTKGMLSN
jgi:hypothetical protein